ncbi:MAG: sugar phosphorylase [Flavobacteriaceae bacterium]|nr:sugar phosphorylase [Flavobacteriaceae bacterium]
MLLDKKYMIDSLTSLYGDRANWVYENIELLINKYASKIKSKEVTLSEKDVILITYGDNVQKQGNSHLQTLDEFVDTYCLPEINSTHILPFYPYTSDDGFSVVDYFKVDSNLGTWDEISNLSKKSNLMFDAVVNHMSKSSKWFQSYLADEKEYQEFFTAVDPKTDLSKVIRPRALPLLTSFKDKNGIERHVWTTFSEDQVDLNFSSPEVFIAILDVLLFYASKGAKLVRLDAIAFIWKTIGTNCIHLPETHLIIKLYKKVLQSLTNNICFITETNVPHQENISYFGNGYDEADMVYNFTLAPLLIYSIMEGNTKVLTKWAQSLELPSDKVCFFNFTASHDGIGMRPLQNIIPDEEIAKLAFRAEKYGGQVSYKNNEDGTQSPYELNCNYMDFLSDKDEDDEIRVRKMLLTQAVMLTIPGVPGIYFHSLIGSRNYYKGVEESDIKRRINREKLNFDDLVLELNTLGSIRNKVFTSYKNALKVRTKEGAFNPFCNAEYFSVDDDKIFIIKRKYKEETIYAIFNFSNKMSQMKALTSNVYNLLDGIEIKEEIWKIAPYHFCWYKEK